MRSVGRWKFARSLFRAGLNQSKRNQLTRRIEVASCHVCAGSALLVLRASNNFDTRLCGLCCMVQEKHASVIGCCATYAMQKPSFDVPSSLPPGFPRRHPHVCLQTVSLSINAPSTLTRPIFRPTDTLSS